VARIRRRDKITSSLSALRANAGDTSTCGRCNKQKPVNYVSPYLGRDELQLGAALARSFRAGNFNDVARQDRDTMKNVLRGGSCRVTQSCVRSSRRIDGIAAARASARDDHGRANFKAYRAPTHRARYRARRAIETGTRGTPQR